MTDYNTTKIESLEAVLKYPFHDLGLAWEALQTPDSIVTDVNDRDITGATRKLPLIGSIVMDLLVAKHWYKKVTNGGKFHPPINNCVLWC